MLLGFDKDGVFVYGILGGNVFRSVYQELRFIEL